MLCLVLGHAYPKSRTLTFPRSAIQTQQEGTRTTTHPYKLSTWFPPETLPTWGIPTPPLTPHQGLLYLSWFSKFSRFPLQDRPAFPQSFPKTTLEPTEDCAEFRVCFLNSALPHLTSSPWQSLNYLITQHWTFSIFHPMMSQIEMQGPRSIWILYCSSSRDGEQTAPHQNLHSDRKMSLCQITTGITSLHKQQEQWNGKNCHAHYPSWKMCSLQRSNREILCILGKKLPKHQETQTILQQCEPDGTYQPSTIPKPAWFLEPQELKTLDLLQTEFMRTFSKQHVGGKEHQLIIIYQDLENITFGCIPCGIPSHFSMDLAQFAWEEASPILEG